jgi:PhnB protein
VQLNPYLLFNGNCEAAFKFYEQCLGGKIETMTPHEGTPAAEHVPPEWRKKILHARMRVGDGILMGTDDNRYQEPRSFSVALHVKDVAEAERVFNALAKNGTVRMPIQQTFWSVRFGMLVDQFGVPWMINCEKAA